ncbi:MAG: hypothetical protein CL760_12885 [Chloroflexi bacterium]|nr:hypothetical protein [Chloroflexota bacterium]|tara:strand:- start:52224 stop:52658 length:435 start_codon:yes stop_codon:yes gene_type:complete
MFDDLVIEKQSKFSKEDILFFFENYDKNVKKAMLLFGGIIMFNIFILNIDIFSEKYDRTFSAFFVIFTFGVGISSFPFFQKITDNMNLAYQIISPDSIIQILESNNVSKKMKLDLLHSVSKHKIDYIKKLDTTQNTKDLIKYIQ